MVVLRLAVMLGLVGLLGALALEFAAPTARGPRRGEIFALRAALVTLAGAAIVSVAIAADAGGTAPIAVVSAVSFAVALILYVALKSAGRLRLLLQSVAALLLFVFAGLAVLSVGFLFIPAAMAIVAAIVLGRWRRGPSAGNPEPPF